MWMTIWTVTIAMALGFSFLATLLKDGATFAGMSANNPKRTLSLRPIGRQSSSGATSAFEVNQVTNKQPNGQEVAMSERYNLELISRRRAFSFLGLTAALSVAVPATVLIATDAEARVGNPGSAVSVAGANRRDRRQDRRYKKSPTTPTTTGQGEKK